MKEILLVSENYIKSTTNVDDNLNGKLLGPSIINAQEIELREILGDVLIDKIKGLVRDNILDLPANVNYKNLILRSQPFLAYSALADVIILTSVKITNAGNEQVDDEKMSSISVSESRELASFYQKKADFYCKRLQNFLLANKDKFPELTQSQCNSIKSNLHSAASCGLWLGGVRGKGYGKKQYN